MKTFKLLLLPAFLALMLGILAPSGLAVNYSNFDHIAVGKSGGSGQFCLNGVCKISLGSIVSPWEDGGTTTTLTSAPTKFVLTHSTGNMAATKFTAGTGDIALENAQTIDGGTNNAVIFGDNSDTFSLVFDGSDVQIETSDGGVIFDLNQADGTVDFMTNNDDDDYIQISTSGNQSLINFVGQNGKITAASGTIDFDDENLTTSGTLGSGATTVTSLIIGDDTLDVVVDDQLRFASNDEETTIEALGYTGKNGVLQLTADLGADAGDKIQLVSDQATNSLLFTSDTSVKDTHATILTLSKVGLLTTTGDIIVAGTTPLVTIGDGGAEDAGIVFDGIADYYFKIDDTGGLEEDILTIGVGSAAGTTPVLSFNATQQMILENDDTFDNVVDDTFKFASNDENTTVLVYAFEAKTARIKMQADEGDDAGDKWQVDANATSNLLNFANDRVLKDTAITYFALQGMPPVDTADTTTLVEIQGTSPADTTGTNTYNYLGIDVAQGNSSGGTNVLNVINIDAMTGDAQVTTNAINIGDMTTGSGADIGMIIGAGWDIVLSMDGATDNAYFTNLVVGDAASSTKTVTLPSVTGSIAIETVATVVITADTTATITVAPGTDQLFTYTIDTDNEDCTLTFSAGGTAGDIATIIFITDAAGSADEVMTFHGTLSDAEGTLTLANGASKRYVIVFISDGTIWNEISRTAVLG